MVARYSRTPREASRGRRRPGLRSSAFATLVGAFIGCSPSQANDLALLFIGPPLPAAVTTPRPVPSRETGRGSEPGEKASRLKAEAKKVAPAAAPVGKAEPRAGRETEERYRVERNKVYFGSEKSFRRPAVVRAETIYLAIPAYRKIVEQGLTRDDPEYWPLMRKTTVRFVRALRAVCERQAYDLVAEAGSLSGESGDEPADVPDVTRGVIAALGEGIASTRR